MLLLRDTSRVLRCTNYDFAQVYAGGGLVKQVSANAFANDEMQVELEDATRALCVCARTRSISGRAASWDTARIVRAVRAKHTPYICIAASPFRG